MIGGQEQIEPAVIVDIDQGGIEYIEVLQRAEIQRDGAESSGTVILINIKPRLGRSDHQIQVVIAVDIAGGQAAPFPKGGPHVFHREFQRLVDADACRFGSHERRRPGG